MDTSLNAVAHAPAPAPRAGHSALKAAGMLVLGLAIGGAATWYGLQPTAPAPEATPAPFASVAAAASPAAAVSVVAWPKASDAWLSDVSCTSDTDCIYNVIIDIKTVGQVHSWKSPAPRVVQSGPGWTVFERPVDGLGGYILYGHYLNLTYANAKGTIAYASTDEVAAMDAAFSPDLSHLAIVTDAGEGQSLAYKIEFMDLATGKIDQVSANIPLTRQDAQAGLPTYSPDGSRLAVVVGYGPDNEKGEIYVTTLSDASSFAKVADTPRPVRELRWMADGSIVWR